MSQTNSEVRIDQLIRSKRRTFAIEINQDGGLIVRAPSHASKAEIAHLLEEKKSWILSKKRLAFEQALETPPKKFTPGEEFLYLGTSYPLEIVEGDHPLLVLKDRFFLAADVQDEAQAVFTDWYRGQAAQVITERAACQAQKYGFSYSKVRINNAKTRWGSCGPKGSLNFPWRLVMAPLEVIDYVIVHELVHLRIRNHSKDFWDSVAQIMPDFKQRRKWIKDHGHRLRLD
jgi:predicted metal-dependent hydrolase